MTLRVAAIDLPTLLVTVRRGLPSGDALLGISFRTMATALSAALESFPYNSEINNDLCQDKMFSYSNMLILLGCLFTNVAYHTHITVSAEAGHGAVMQTSTDWSYHP